MSITSIENAVVTALKATYADAVAEVEFLEDLASRRLKALGILGTHAPTAEIVAATAETDSTAAEATAAATDAPAATEVTTTTTEAAAADPQPAAAATASSAG